MRARDAAGFAVFLVGTYLNVASELQRHWWKQDTANAGLLFTGQLWQLCRHVNYFGEVASFAGLAMHCGTWNLWIAVAMEIAYDYLYRAEEQSPLPKRCTPPAKTATRGWSYQMGRGLCRARQI